MLCCMEILGWPHFIFSFDRSQPPVRDPNKPFSSRKTTKSAAAQSELFRQAFWFDKRNKSCPVDISVSFLCYCLWSSAMWVITKYKPVFFFFYPLLILGSKIAKLDRMSVYFSFNGFTIKLVSHIFALGSINFCSKNEML